MHRGGTDPRGGRGPAWIDRGRASGHAGAITDPACHAKLIHFFAEALSPVAPPARAWEISLLAANGEPLLFELTARPLDGTSPEWAISGAPVTALSGSDPLAVLSDIARLNNELALAQRESARQTAALTRTVEDLERFATMVSHDLVAPARQLRQLVMLFDRDELASRLDERAAGWLRHIASSAIRMERLVNDTLDYARLGGARAVNMHPTRLDVVLDEAAATLAPEMAESGAQLLRRPEPLPAVCVNAVQAEVLFRNLIGNAIQYAQPGVPPRVAVETAVSSGGGRWEVAVTDNGQGIAAEARARVFEMYTRLNPAASPGSGVGLAICRRVVELHGGTITLESELGQGSTFRFSLPAA